MYKNELQMFTEKVLHVFDLGASGTTHCPEVRCAIDCEVDYRGTCPRCVCPKACKVSKKFL